MIIHYFHPISDFNLSASVVTKSGEKKDILINPESGRLGHFQEEDDITFTIVVSEEHSCYTLNPKDLQPVPKKFSPEGKYEKSLKVCKNYGKLQVAPWPCNMLCLDVCDKKFNVGIVNQYDNFYLVTEEFIPDPPELVFMPGEVRWFSLLRGIGSVTSENQIFDHRIYWKKVSQRQNGLRYLETHDLLTNLKYNKTLTSTVFRTEIEEATLVPA